MKKYAWAALAAVTLLGTTGQAHAWRVSRFNPYRAFKGTGINYGAQQLERQRRMNIVEGRYGGAYTQGQSGYGGTVPLASSSGHWEYHSAYGWSRPGAARCW